MEALYTAKEAASLLKVNVNYIHDLRKAGLLHFMKLGNYKVRETELERFLAAAEGKDLTDPYNITQLV